VADLNLAASNLEGGIRRAAQDAIAKAAVGTAANGVNSDAATLPPAAAIRPASATASTLRSSVTGSLGGGVSVAPSAKSASNLVRSSIARHTSTGLASGAGVRGSLSLNKSARPSVAGTAPASGQSEDGPLYCPDGKKEERARKGKFRPAKLEIRPDEAATLEAELGPLVSPHLRGLLVGMYTTQKQGLGCRDRCTRPRLCFCHCV
jgi:cytoskeleton-associated protein 5